MIKKIDHIGIIVQDSNISLKFFAEALGLQPILQETIEEQGVKVTVLPIGEINIELIEPIVPDTGVAKFLENRGEGIHHIAVEVDDVQESVNDLLKKETRMIDLEPKRGAHNKQIAFVHPKAAHGVLLELCHDEHDDNSPADLSNESSCEEPLHPCFNGLVQVYTGDGKGKTTAALGLAIRATGQGLRVYIGQFMKGKSYGELATLARMSNLTIKQFGRPSWVQAKGITPEDRACAEEGFKEVTEAIQSGNYDLVILDEINLTATWGLIPIDKIVDLVKTKPQNVEIVLTGRQAPQELLDLADYVTEMREIKHPYQKGINARGGIEY